MNKCVTTNISNVTTTIQDKNNKLLFQKKKQMVKKNTILAIKNDILYETAICLIVKNTQTFHVDLNPNNKHIIDLGHGMGYKEIIQLNNILMTKTT